MTKVKYDPILDALREDDTGAGGGGGDDDANELIAATPFTTTTMPDPFTAEDTTVMLWPTDVNEVMAFGLEGDTYPRWAFYPDGQAGIYMGRGQDLGVAAGNFYVGGSNGNIMIWNPYGTGNGIEFNVSDSSPISKFESHQNDGSWTLTGVNGLVMGTNSAPLTLTDASAGSHDITVDAVPNLLNDGNAVGIQPATNPTAITDISNPITGSGTMRFVQWPVDTVMLATGIEGDDFPRWLFSVDASDGLYFGDGTYDPYTDGCNLYADGANLKLQSFNGAVNLFPATGFAVNVGGDTGLHIISPSIPLTLTDEASGSHNLTVDSVDGLLYDGSPIAGGGGSGITRTRTVTSAGFTAGNTALTDYVYLIAGAHTPTMPAAASNSNRYTFKNNHSANVTVTAGGTDTVEGVASYSLAPGESIDLISDNTSNWNII